MGFGDVVRLSGIGRDIAIANRLGARDALAMTLSAFLLKLQFRVDGVDDRDTVFHLRRVFPEWPSSRRDLPYPCASIIDAGDLQHVAHNLTPTLLEETWGQFDVMVGHTTNGKKRTVLMKESGARQEFQVDFWTDKPADRQAIAALLPSIFSPGEGRSGVIVEGPSLYYSRNMRFSLISSTYDDTAASASVNERRLRASVIGECDIVSLREAVEMPAPNICLSVKDPADPTNEESGE